VTLPDVIDAGVMSCGLLDFGLRTNGAGEPLRSSDGDFGGTCGGSSRSSATLEVSSFNIGLILLFGLAPGLRIGDKGLLGILSDSGEKRRSFSCCIGDGPVTQAINASPKGPALQLVPGALHDLSCPKASYDSFLRGGLPGIVADII
jgi:hypothetical protein